MKLAQFFNLQAKNAFVPYRHATCCVTSGFVVNLLFIMFIEFHALNLLSKALIKRDTYNRYFGGFAIFNYRLMKAKSLYKTK